MSGKIIIDCDNTLGILLNEVDDGLTILYLLGTPNLELLGVTTTFGNGRIDQVYPQTQKLVKHLDLDLPVLKGEGEANLGQATDASRFLVDQVDRRPGEITLLAIGPLGNLHAAALEDPDFFSKVKHIIVMGGYLQPVWLGYRNLKELNFSAHPEASLRVLSSACPAVTVFPAQACLDAPYCLRDIRRADYWPGWMKRTLTQWLLTFSLYTGGRVFYLWDLLPAVFLVNPEIFNIEPFPLGSNLADLQQGMLIKAQEKSAPVIQLASGIRDRQAFFNELERGWRKAADTFPL